MTLIEFDNVRYRYGSGTPALDGLSLSIEAGEFVCIIGGNGSGKSTLARHMNALLVPNEGSVRIDGLDTREPENLFRIRSRVGMVFQNPDDQIVASLVEDEVAFGPENLGLEPGEIRRRVTNALAETGLAGLERHLTDTLSGGQKQRLAIAGALAIQPNVLVLDEAASMLDPHGRNDLMRICRQLNDAGMTIVLITHFMDQAACADRVVALDAGRVVLQGAPADVLTRAVELRSIRLEPPFAAHLSHELAHHGVPIDPCLDERTLADQIASLATISHASLPSDLTTARGNVDTAECVLAFESVSYSYDPQPNGSRALREISFSLSRGEILGIAGPMGSGKSTLAQLAGNLLTPSDGRIETRDSVGVVFQYPERQLFAPTVLEDVSFGPSNVGLNPDEVADRVRDALELVHLSIDELGERSPFALSGGQQRLVAFAGMLALRPAILVMDEPTACLDPQAKRSFLDLLRELNEEHGITLVVVSHDMDDLAELCDRVIVLKEGGIIAADTPARIFAQESLVESANLELPHAMRLANHLRARGIEGIAADSVPNGQSLAHACLSLMQPE